MIYLKLFLNFLKIGAFTFGGGYAMIPLIQETVLKNSWLSEEEILNFIAVSESTPGPIAVNMATFVGTSQGGFFGGLSATLGVILPAFVIILLVAAVMRNLLKFAGVQAFLKGVRPAVMALILSVSVTMGLKVLFSFSKAGDNVSSDWRSFLILAVVILAAFLWKKLRKKKISPILLIVVSAILGIILF